MKYNSWLVLGEEKIHKENRVYLKCICDCGTLRDVIIKNLKSGVSSSCGCIGRKKTIERNTKHGKRYTKVYKTWQDMKARCSNKNMKQYKDYGGRGIRVCDEWEGDFMAFYKVVGDAPKNMTIDRIDNDGNYEPSNVKWSTVSEQCQNKRNNRKIDGVCINEIDKKLGGRSGLVSKRLKRGWPIKRAITEKPHERI